MFRLTIENLKYIHSLPKEKFDDFLLLEDSAVVKDICGDTYLAFIVAPKEENCIYLYAKTDLDFSKIDKIYPSPDRPDVYNPLFWTRERECFIPVRKVSLQRLLTEYTVVKSVEDTDTDTRDICMYKNIDVLPLGSNDRDYDYDKMQFVTIEQYVYVVKRADHIILYIFDTDSILEVHMDASTSVTSYEDLKNAVLTELPRLVLAYALAGQQDYISVEKDGVILEVSSDTLNVADEEHVISFTYLGEDEDNILSAAIRWK